MNLLYSLLGSPVESDLSSEYRGLYNPWSGTVHVNPQLDPMWWNEAYGHESQHKKQYSDNAFKAFLQSALANLQLYRGNENAYWNAPHEVDARQAGTNYLKDMY